MKNEKRLTVVAVVVVAAAAVGAATYDGVSAWHRHTVHRRTYQAVVGMMMAGEVNFRVKLHLNFP